MVADVSSAESLRALTCSVAVLINCVGPFRFFGEAVVQAAIEGGCHYVDITGEPEFMELSQLKFHDAAVEKGLRIVHGCGMDSIPADVVSRYAAREFEKRFPGSVATEVEHTWSVSGNGHGVAVHYGTWHSLVHSMSSVGSLRATRKQLAKRWPTQVAYRGAKQQRSKGPRYSADAGRWVLPFPGADASVVRRTQQHLTACQPRETPLQYAVYFSVPEWYHVLLFMLFGVVLQALTSVSWGVQLLLAYPGLFSFGVFSHQGPTAEQLAATTFECLFRVKGYTNASDAGVGSKVHPNAGLLFSLRGPEPGYIATSSMVVAAARALGEDGDIYPAEDPTTTGVLTPGSAFNHSDVMQRMLGRLNERGVRLLELKAE